jgi:hypothetical protein
MNGATMKLRGLALSFLTAAVVFAWNVNNGYSASGSRGSFEQRKAQQLKRVETRIAHLQEQRTCISAATNEDAIQACGNGFNQRSAAVNFDQSRFLWSGFLCAGC